MENIVIYGDRKKLIRPFVRSGLFLLLGALLLILSDTYASKIGSEAMVLRIFSVISILYWTTDLLLLGRTSIRYGKPRLILSSKSLTFYDHNSNWRYEIDWRQMTSIIEYQLDRKPAIIGINLIDPQQFIDTEPSIKRRKTMVSDIAIYGTPFYLWPSLLKFPNGELIFLLQQYHQQYSTWTNPN